MNTKWRYIKETYISLINLDIVVFCYYLKHFFVATWLLVCNFIFPLKSLCKENILTNQMKNEYFQDNLEKRTEILKRMILAEVPNESLERKSKSQWKLTFFWTLSNKITSQKIFFYFGIYFFFREFHLEFWKVSFPLWFWFSFPDFLENIHFSFDL